MSVKWFSVMSAPCSQSWVSTLISVKAGLWPGSISQISPFVPKLHSSECFLIRTTEWSEDNPHLENILQILHCQLMWKLIKIIVILSYNWVSKGEQASVRRICVYWKSLWTVTSLHFERRQVHNDSYSIELFIVCLKIKKFSHYNE